ncbi:TIR domain-containing protein [Thermodesulfobacteriota bacterium]
MNGLAPLNVFISYAGSGRDVWEPLVKALEETYGCRIIWGMDEARKYESVPQMMQQMVNQSDVAIFLMTHSSPGLEEELQLWCKHHGNTVVNALLLKDPDFDTAVLFETLRLKGVTPTPPLTIPLSRKDPWRDLQYALPAIHTLFCETPKPGPGWARRYNRIIHEASSAISRSEIPVGHIRSVFERICSLPLYESPDRWRFRVNWIRTPFSIDGYSKEVTCLDLLWAILHPNVAARAHEVRALFTALDRIIMSRKQPPKKLAGGILLEGSSSQTSRGVMELLKCYPYERPPQEREEELSEILRNDPEGLLPSKEVLLFGDNLERILAAQDDILAATSRICNYVLCSTFQISISRAIPLYYPDTKSQILGVACTAAGTDKERLAAIADIPLLVRLPAGTDAKIAWFGQKHRKPTSEHRAHWRFHERCREAHGEAQLIVHLHPVELLELFNLITHGDISESAVIDEVEKAFRAVGLKCVVYEDYIAHGARSEAFGNFLFDELSVRRSDSIQTSVVWKPNHGVWFLTPVVDHVVEILVRIEDAAQRATVRFHSVPN